jgi:hypothetical protein
LPLQIGFLSIARITERLKTRWSENRPDAVLAVAYDLP